MQYYKEREEKIDFRLRFHQENWKNTAALNSLLLQTHIPSQAVEVDGGKTQLGQVTIQEMGQQTKGKWTNSQKTVQLMNGPRITQISCFQWYNLFFDQTNQLWCCDK